jgi:hypothetical protein
LGLNSAGTPGFGFIGSAIYVHNNSTNIVIGTNGDNIGDTDERNVITSCIGASGYGIYIFNCPNMASTIAGNYIGLAANGTTAGGNNIGLIVDQSSDIRIGTNADGTSDAAERNIIVNSINRGMGIWNSSNLVTVAGNYIGVLPDGVTAAGNADAAIDIFNSANIRIGTNADGVNDAAERNIISANGWGMNINGASTNNVTVAGNYIGVAADGTTARGNTNYGIGIYNGANSNRIGSNNDGTNDNVESNIIAHQGSRGVMVTNNNTIRNLISRNIFYRNGGAPIDLFFNNHTPNNGTTLATDPNIGLDYPVITEYTLTGGVNLTLTGYVGNCNTALTNPGTVITDPLTIELYKSDNTPADQSGAITNLACGGFSTNHGEGSVYLGRFSVTGGIFTNQAVTLTTPIAATDSITAIAIDATGNTSEFGPAVRFSILNNNNTIALTGTNAYGNITLKWNHIGDNVKQYEVQRSTNALAFSTFYTAQPLAIQQQQWNFIEQTKQKLYYRIKAMLATGKELYSNIYTVNNTMAGYAWMLYPQQFNNTFTVEVKATTTNKMKLFVLDVNGKTVHTVEKTLTPGNNSFLINNLSNLANGVYTVQLWIGNTTTTKRIVKY